MTTSPTSLAVMTWKASSPPSSSLDQGGRRPSLAPSQRDRASNDLRDDGILLLRGPLSPGRGREAG